MKYLFSLFAVGALLLSISPAARAQTEVRDPGAKPLPERDG